MNHMDLVNKLRNSQAAHSGVQALNIRPAAESKAQLLHDMDDALNDFVHMLSHLENLEVKILVDLAQKRKAINRLKESGLKAEDCNFNLVPGHPFVFNSEQARTSTD